LIIHPEFKPDSPLQSILESSSFDQSVSDDQTYVIQPISVAQPENSLKATLDNLANKETILEPVIQPAFPKPIFDGIIISDSDEEDEHVMHVDNVLDSFVPFVLESVNDPPITASTSHAIEEVNKVSIPTPQTINVSPPTTLLLDSIVLREVCENIF
jgi:hypothetical protein